MAKPNYQFEKRRRDIEKKKKQDEKRMRKLEEKRAKKTDGSDPTIENAPENEPKGDSVSS